MGKRGRPKQVRIATQVCVDFVPRTVTVASTGKKDSRLSAPIPDSNVIRQYDPIGDFKPYIADVEGKLTDHVFEKGNPLRIWFRCQLLHNGQVHKTFPVFKSKGQLTFISHWSHLGTWSVSIEAVRRVGKTGDTFTTDLGGGRKLPPWVRTFRVLHPIPSFVKPLELRSEDEIFNGTPVDLALSFEDYYQKSTVPDECYDAVFECSFVEFEHSRTELSGDQLIIKDVKAKNPIGEEVKEIELAVRLKSKNANDFAFKKVHWTFINERPKPKVSLQNLQRDLSTVYNKEPRAIRLFCPTESDMTEIMEIKDTTTIDWTAGALIDNITFKLYDQDAKEITEPQVSFENLMVSWRDASYSGISTVDDLKSGKLPRIKAPVSTSNGNESFSVKFFSTSRAPRTAATFEFQFGVKTRPGKAHSIEASLFKPTNNSVLAGKALKNNFLQVKIRDKHGNDVDDINESSLAEVSLSCLTNDIVKAKLVKEVGGEPGLIIVKNISFAKQTLGEFRVNVVYQNFRDFVLLNVVPYRSIGWDLPGHTVDSLDLLTLALDERINIRLQLFDEDGNEVEDNVPTRIGINKHLKLSCPKTMLSDESGLADYGETFISFNNQNQPTKDCPFKVCEKKCYGSFAVKAKAVYQNVELETTQLNLHVTCDSVLQEEVDIDENANTDTEDVAVRLPSTSTGFTNPLFNFHFFDDLTKLRHQRHKVVKQIPDFGQDVLEARAEVDKFIAKYIDKEAAGDQLNNPSKTTSEKVVGAISILERQEKELLLREEQRRLNEAGIPVIDLESRDTPVQLPPLPLLGFVEELIKRLKNLHEKDIYFTQLLKEKQIEETKLSMEIKRRKAHRCDQGAKKRSASTENRNGKRSRTS